MAFHVGQKVVCVNASCSGGFLKEEAIYTVKEHGHGTQSGETIYLVEAFAANGCADPGFWTKRFRPLVEKKTSTDTGMKILREILERESVEERKPARVRE